MQQISIYNYKKMYRVPVDIYDLVFGLKNLS